VPSFVSTFAAPQPSLLLSMAYSNSMSAIHVGATRIGGALPLSGQNVSILTE